MPAELLGWIEMDADVWIRLDNRPVVDLKQLAFLYEDLVFLTG